MEKTIPDCNALLQINPLPTLVYDVSHYTIVNANEAAINWYGYTIAEFLELSIKDLLYQANDKNLLALHTYTQQECNTALLSFGQLQHIKKNGEHVQVQMTGQKIVNNGQASVMVVVQALPESSQYANRLKDTEEKLINASAIAKLGYWKLELDGSKLSWSDEIYNIWGRSKAAFELNYPNFFETIHPADRAFFEKEQAASLAGLKEHNIVHRILMPDGAVKWVQELGCLVKDSHGNLIAFEGTAQDVTAQKLEEQHLKLLESVIINANDAVVITEAEPFDAPGPRILYVNEAFTKMTGYTASEVIGKTPRLLQGPGSDPNTIATLGQSIRAWQPTEVTLLNYKKNGDEFWIHMSISPVADDNGWYTHWISIERDVTAEKNKVLEQALLSKINLIFRDAANLTTAAQHICKVFADFANFDIAEIWLPNIERNKIRLISSINETAVSDIFYRHAEGFTAFTMGEGLPGSVWQAEASILWSDAEIKNSFVRSDAAKIAGLKSVLGIPLLFNAKVVGVLIVGSIKEANKLKKYLNIFQQLESAIGSELNRKVLESDLSHLFDALPDIICLADFSGRILRINTAGCTMLGYEENEILYHSFDEFVHPDDKDISLNEVQKLSKGASILKFENRYILKNGNVVWLSWTCNSELNTGVIYASAKDITTEKKLWLLNQQANQLAKIGSWEIDLSSHKIYWSDMVHEIHETDVKSFIPELSTAIQYYRADFVDFVTEQVDACVQHCIPFDFEAVLVTAKNRECWVRAIGISEQINGVCKRIYGSVQDIHSTKTLNLQIKEILGSISDAFYALDSNWNFTYFNKEAENILNFKEADLIGKNKWEQFPDTLGTPMEAIYHRVVLTGKGETFEYFFSSNQQWFEVNTYPSNGGVSSYFKNITERKQTAVLMQKAFEEKTMILESIDDAFFTVDKNFVVTYWNHKAEALLNTKREAILGKNIWDVFPDAINLPIYHYCHEALKTNASCVFEDFYADKHLEINVYPSDKGLTIFFKDISERKQAELQLLTANERFEKATQATNDAIWDWNITDDTLFWGGGFKTKFGYEIDKVASTLDNWIERIHPEDYEEVQRSLYEMLNDPQQDIWQGEYRYKKEDGSYAYVMDRGATIRDGAGKAIRMIGAMADISERKKQEAQLLALNESLKKYSHDLEITNEQLEQFAFIASHDLQEPLRMIASFLSQLKKKYGDKIDEKGHQYIHFATDGAKRMKQIILDLLEYSRAGKFEENLEQISLATVIADYKILRRKIITETSAKISTTNLATVTAYKAPFVQVIHCLLDNAIKYAKKDIAPIIEFSVIAEEQSLLFLISDNGLGIEGEFFDKIFIIFQRLHNRDEYSGTGIGLAIVKKHIESWGGKIWLTSTPGIGTNFYFTMPIVAVRIIETNADNNYLPY